MTLLKSHQFWGRMWICSTSNSWLTEKDMASWKSKTPCWVCSPGLWLMKSHCAAHPQLSNIGGNIFKTAQQNKIICWSMYSLKCDQDFFFFFSCSLLTFYCIKEEFLGKKAAAVSKVHFHLRRSWYWTKSRYLSGAGIVAKFWSEAKRSSESEAYSIIKL